MLQKAYRKEMINMTLLKKKVQLLTNYKDFRNQIESIWERQKQLKASCLRTLKDKETSLMKEK